MLASKFFAAVVAAVFFYSSFSNCKESYQSQNLDPISSSKWSLPEKSAYQTIFRLTDKNYEEILSESEDPWVIVFYKVKIDKKWIQHSKVVSGSLWYGKVDLDANPVLAEKLDFNDKTKNYIGGVAAIFPSKSSQTLQNLNLRKVKAVMEPGLAEAMAGESMLDLTTKFDFTPATMQKFNDWIVDSYYKSDITRFPIICVTDEPGVPLLVKSLSRYFKSHFSFAIVSKASVPRLLATFKEVQEPTEFPMFYMLMGREPSSDEMNRGIYNMHFNIFPYVSAKYGDSKHFHNVVNYLYVANQDYRQMLPGRRNDESNSAKNMKGISEELSNRVNRLIKSQRKLKNKKTEL